MSTKLKDLTEAYRQFLASINVTTQSDDLLIQDIDGLQSQVMVDSKPLALPTEAIVNNYSDSIVVFHPICENLLLGESPVIHETRMLIMEFLNDRILQLIDSILSIAIDEELVSSLTPKQMEFMRCAAGADSTSLKNWRSIMRRADTRGSANRVVTIFLKRGAMHGGSKHKRVANVNFNLVSDIDDGNLTLFGAKVRKSDLKLYSSIFRAIFDKLDDEDGYSAPSDSLTAPYFESLLHAYYNILEDMNGVTWNLRKPIEQTTGRKLHVNTDFMDAFRDILQYRDVLPTMPLNDGDRNARREEEQVTQNNTDPAPLPANTQNSINNMAAQASPYYDQTVSVQTQQPQDVPVQAPQFNNAPIQQPITPSINQQSSNNNFPSLQEQLSGVPLSGYTQPQGHFPPQMNPYQQPGMNPYQQMNPYQMQQPGMNPYQQPMNMQQMNPYQQQMPMQQMNPYQQQPASPFGFPQANMGMYR